MDQETFIWIGVLGFAISVIALFFAFGAGIDYNFNSTQFITNGVNISINQSWINNASNFTEVDPLSYHEGNNINMQTNNITNVTMINIKEVTGACNLTAGAGISKNSTHYCFT